MGFAGEVSVTGKKGSSGNRGREDKEAAAKRDTGEGNGNPLQSSCLENPTNRGAWWATVHGVIESDTTEQRDTEEMEQQDRKGLSSRRGRGLRRFTAPPLVVC